MSDDPIPDSNHISRLIGGSKIDDFGNISPEAFMLRKEKSTETYEEYLSVNWLEYYNQKSRELDINEIRNALLAKGMNLPSKGKLGVLNAGELIQHVSNETEGNKLLSVLHKPDQLDPSHSGIFGLNPDDSITPALIAQKVFETYPAKSQLNL